MNEPRIHSHITDCLPHSHLSAYDMVYCCTCKNILHAANNECMQTWVETGIGPFCIMCFAKHPEIEALDDDFGLLEVDE